MATLRFTDDRLWHELEAHLTTGNKERFAFALCDLIGTSDGPSTLRVRHIRTIDDRHVQADEDGRGFSVVGSALDDVHNEAIRSGQVLVEFHNHRFGPPRFSRTDRAALEPMAGYVTDIHPAKMYGAAVYAEGHLYFRSWSCESGSVTCRDGDVVRASHSTLATLLTSDNPEKGRLARQRPILGEEGTNTLARLKTAVVGLGGTGSQVALALVYLGLKHTLLLDGDRVESTNLNRLVTATRRDIGELKSVVARRRMLEIDPTLDVQIGDSITGDGDPRLLEADLIIGCVDHDGPRDLLNDIAVATGAPFIDVASGIDPNTRPIAVGGRVSIVVPGGPCLHCRNELDPAEISRWVKSSHQQELDRAHGYGTAAPNPAVVHLNGLVANAAMAELVAWIAGHRSPALDLDVDVNGYLALSDDSPGVRVTKRQPHRRSSDCIACSTGIAAT